MTKNQKILASYKLFFGLLGLSSVVTEIVVLINRGTFVPANFFSFFTIESNIFAATILLISAVATSVNRQSALLDLFRGAATLYMITTGIVFAALLSGLDANILTAVPWDNTVLHYIMPIILLVDWLIDPPKRRIPFKKAAYWLAYPLLYAFYSLFRGHFNGWYPYPFFNPEDNGYGVIAITCICIAAVVAFFAWLVTLVRTAPSRATSSKNNLHK